MNLAFGESRDVAAAEALAKAWTSGDFSSIPEIEIRLGAEINGAASVFAGATNTIYISREYLSYNADNIEATAGVLLEEIGHAVDALVNDADSPGDEGAIFSALVRGQTLEPQQLEQMKAENDTTSITLDGQVIQIEQAESGLIEGGFEGSVITIPLESNGGGTARYFYEHFVIPDQFILRYEGKNILDTGFVGGSRTGEVDIPQGTSNQLEVILATNDIDTEWKYSVSTSPPSVPSAIGQPSDVAIGDDDKPVNNTVDQPINPVTQRPPDIATKHGVYEFLAKDTSYKNLQENLRIEDQTFPGKINETEQQFLYQNFLPENMINEYGYKVDRVFNEQGKRETGFYALALTSDMGKPPVLVVRGTEPNPDDVFADIFADVDPRGIGFNQFQNNQQEVLNWLQGQNQKQQRPDIVGHSLGGALTQFIAAEFTKTGGQLGEVVTFNSPGISENAANQFNRALTENVTHYIMAGDLVSLGGEKFLEGNWEIFSYSDLGAYLNNVTLDKHLNPMLVEDVGYDNPILSDDSIKQPSTLTSNKFNTVSWLNNELFTYINPDFLLVMAGASAIVSAGDTVSTLLNQAPDLTKDDLKGVADLLFFRGTVESLRKGINEISLGGKVLPAFTQIVNAVNTNFLDDNGFTLPNGIFNIPLPPWNLGGLRFEPDGGVTISVLPGTPENQLDDRLKLQSKVSVISPGLSRFTADLAGDNFIQITNSGVDIVGAVSVDSIKLVPNLWEIKNAKFAFDPIQNKYAGKASLIIPITRGATLEGGFELENGIFNYLSLGLDDISVPVLNTGLNLRKIRGGVTNINTLDFAKIQLDGNLRLTNTGEEIRLPPLPSWIQIPGLNPNVSFPLINIDVAGRLNSELFEASGVVNLLGGLAEATATIEINWNEGIVEVREANFSALGGFISADAAWKINSKLDMTIAGDARIQLPQGLPIPDQLGLFSELIRKYQQEPLAQGGFEFRYLNDNSFSNDYFAGWAKIPGLPLDLTLTSFLNGDYALQPGAKSIPETNSFIIQPGTEWVILGADWDNASSNVPIQIELPNGIVLNESDFAANNITIVDDMTGANTKGVIVFNPTPGVWDLNVDNPTGLGNVRYSAFENAPKPNIDLTSVGFSSTASEVNINYNAFDPDSDAEISLFYDTDNEGFDGIPITTQLSESDGSGSFVWNAEGIPTGDYYIYAIIKDENNPPSFSYSPGRVKITESADLSLSKTISTDPVIVGSNLTYAMTVTNNGSNTARDVVLTDTLPEGLNFVSASVPATQQDRDLIFNLGDLPSGASTTVNVTVNPEIVGTISEMTAIATIKTFDSDATNDVTVDTVEIVPPNTDLSVTTDSSPVSLNLGDPIVYNLTVTNNGSITATDVNLISNLPSEIKDVSITSSKGVASQTNGVVTANLGNLNSGEAATVTISASSIAAGNFTNTTTVASNEADLNSANNSLIQRTTVNPATPAAADLELTKTVDNPNPNVGDQIIFTLTLTNKGVGVATGIQVTDLLPPELSFVSADSIQGTYDPITGIWNVGNMRDNLSRSLNITARVNTGGSLATVAEVTTVREPDPDSTPNNNNPDEDDRASVSLNGSGGSREFKDIFGIGDPPIVI